MLSTGDDLEVVLDGLVAVGQGLGLDALGGVHQQDRPLAGRQGPADLVAEVDVARGVDEVQDVVGVVHPDVLGLDGDAPLPLDVHRVEVLLAHEPGVDGPGQLQDAVRQGRLAVVDVADDREVPDALGGDRGRAGTRSNDGTGLLRYARSERPPPAASRGTGVVREAGRRPVGRPSPAGRAAGRPSPPCLALAVVLGGCSFVTGVLRTQTDIENAGFGNATVDYHTTAGPPRWSSPPTPGRRGPRGWRPSPGPWPQWCGRTSRGNSTPLTVTIDQPGHQDVHPRPPVALLGTRPNTLDAQSLSSEAAQEGHVLLLVADRRGAGGPGRWSAVVVWSVRRSREKRRRQQAALMMTVLPPEMWALAGDQGTAAYTVAERPPAATAGAPPLTGWPPDLRATPAPGPAAWPATPAPPAPPRPPARPHLRHPAGRPPPPAPGWPAPPHRDAAGAGRAP